MIRFKRTWFCKPLMEGEFRGAVQNFSTKNKFSFGLSHQQVAKLLHLFSSRNRLRLCQNPRLNDDLPRELETSQAKVTEVQSSPNSSSCGSFRSPCQTCSSSTLGDKLTDSVPLVNRGLQSDILDVAKSKSSQLTLHTGADIASVTISSNQEALHDQAADDYIPLPQEEDSLEGVDDLFGLLKDDSHSSESEGSSDSEGHTTFHQVCVRKEKEDGCYPPMLHSKLRSDSEGRTSVFSRLVKTHKTHNQEKGSKTEAFPPKSAQSFDPLSQRKKKWKAQRCKSFPCHNYGMLDMPSGDWLNRAPASNHSFVWRRSTKYSWGRQSEIRTGDASNKQPVRYDSCKRSFVPKGCSKLIDSFGNELNMPAVFAGEHDSIEVNVKKEMRTSSMNFKKRANDSYVGGDQDFYSEDVLGTGRKKRQATASFHQEYAGDTALVPKSTKTLDMAISDENFKERSIVLSSKDEHTQLATPDLETKVLLQDEQQQSFQGSFEYVEAIACDSSLILESSRTINTLGEHTFGDKKTSLNDETQSHVTAVHLGTEISLQQKDCQSTRNCHRVVNGDKILLLGKFETMDILPNHDEDCENKSLPSDGSDRLVTSYHLETEMAMLEKQTSNIQSCSEVVHDDVVLAPEISKVVFPKSDAECGNKGTSFDQEDDETMYLVTDSKSHTNTANVYSSDGSHNSTRTDDPECCKPMLLEEEQYRNFQGNSNSLDSFAVLSEGCGSKSGLSVDRTSGHLVADLLGMNSESRTSFINDSSSGSVEAFSASALNGDNADHNVNRSEAYAEPPILQHDPGEATQQL
nr:unnamed protein product [Digitaria exilis]